jgi:hypothetical protein
MKKPYESWDIKESNGMAVYFDRLAVPSQKDCCIKTHSNISFLKDTDKTE